MQDSKSPLSDRLSAPAGAGSSFGELRLDGVSRSFGSAVALAGLTMTVRRGEFVTLLGHSGCGKTTALNCVAGLLPLTSGTVWLDDRRIDVLRPEERGFGMVFQNYALFPHMTVRRNTGFGLAMRRLPRDEIRRRVGEVLDLVKLSAHADKLPGQLSGGQQQRVAIARAIVVQPPLVLMDEPLSNLDASLRLEMRTELKRIHRELGRSTIYVTHDQDEALSLSDRIVMLQDGRVQQIATPEDIYARPATIDVARFMGYRNLFELDVASVDGDWANVAGKGIALRGLRRGEIGRRAVVAIRPNDLVLDGGSEGGIVGRVEIVEYCGREYIVDLITDAGTMLQARSAQRVAPGDVLRCHASADRVLIYPVASGAA
ncbi:MAG: ABC transporter ATP-binding protein [Alphaproteobacteria bacterium]|nr:ABC transporter ATP-binding protein [Alphaproteobacteria bacterium]